MRINGSKFGDNKIKFSCFKPNDSFLSKKSKDDLKKTITIHIDKKPYLIYKSSPKSNSNQPKKKESEKQLLKSRTLCIKKDYNNKEKSKEKSNTFNSKSQSMTPPNYDSDKLNLHKSNVNMGSDIMYHSESNEKKLYFYINDNKANKKYKISNNKISTTKYNLITFFPKSLLLQFTRLANIFFLFTAIIQSIPVISPLTSLTAIIPLIFVLGVSMIREFFEDWTRKTYDDINNLEEVVVFRDGSFKKVSSQSLRIGEILIVPEGKTIPADMILIDSGLRDGLAYVETSSLDGEKALKFKLSNKMTVGVFSEDNNKREINFRNLVIGGDIEICPPNQNLNEISGKIKFYLKINDKIKANYVNYEITNKEFILKGSILRNTNWIVGVIVYTGMNNKIILNSKKPRTKISKVEKKMNFYLIYVFIFLMICCLICSFLHHNGYNKNILFYTNFLLIKRNPIFESFITFFTYFLLLNTMIPISLIVTIEIIKMIQGLLIEWDSKLYSKFRHVFCKARAVSINEELGNVNFIFSDKTGTLTLNQLKFKYCIINQKCYAYKRDININSNFNKTFSLASDKKLLENFKYIKEITPFYENHFSNEVSNKRSYIKENKNVKNKTKEINEIKEEIDNIDEFWKAIALTNECMVSEEKGEIKYLGTSPDDNELVRTACSQGYKLFSTSIDKKMIRIGREGEFSFEILHVLGFSSERKRMSIIFRDKNKIKIYCKGADMEIIKRLSIKEKKRHRFKVLSTELDNFSKFGYRTLMVACKIIKEMDYRSWIDKIRKVEKFKDNSKIMEKLYDIIECDFELLGGTVLEDKLQNKVPETINSLKMADIRIWVLTGDKMDTVENIGISCNLLSYEEKMFKIYTLAKDDNEDDQDFSKEITNFFSEFKTFLELTALRNKKKKNIQIYSSNNKIQDICDKSSINISDLNPEYLSRLKGNNLMKNFSIIIESPLLNGLFRDEELTEKFLGIAQYATTVMCCRASPYQKSQVVQKIKKFNPKAVTLAIGDGRNDISMLMEANIGVGIFGEEGTSAAQAADFAIGEFKLLKRLLFFHGRVNMNRISKMIIYFFYKNFIFTMTQFFFAFYNLSSGQTLMDDWYITCYNLIFTAFPLCVTSLTDIDVKEEDSEECKQSMPLLYKESRDTKKYFTLFRFIFTVLKSIILSCIIFLLCSYSTIIDINGYFSNIWYMSLKNYSCILIVITINLFIGTNFIIYYLPIVVIITTFLFFIAFLFLVHYGLIFEFNSKASIFGSLCNIKFYLILFGISTFNAVLDYSQKVYKIFFKESLNGQLELKRALLTLEENNRNDFSINSSINKSEMQRDNNKSRHLRKSFLGNGNAHRNKNTSFMESSNIKIKTNEINDFSNLNNINQKRGFDENNYYVSKVFKNSNSLSSNNQNKSNIINNYHIINNKSIRNESLFNGNIMENNNKNSEIINININNNKIYYKNRNFTFLKRINDNNIVSINSNYDNENNSQK